MREIKKKEARERYKRRKSSGSYVSYCKIRNRITGEVREAKYTLELQLAKETKSNT